MATEFDQLAAEKYVLLTTFRKNGTGVGTAVWAAGDAGELLVWTQRDSGKVKRVRRDGRVQLQACDARGHRTHGPKLTGRARLLDDEGSDRTRRAIGRKYGVLGRLSMLFSRLRGGKERTVGMAIVPS
jgi:PPOX class probable F420-dependent enzyme